MKLEKKKMYLQNTTILPCKEIALVKNRLLGLFLKEKRRFLIKDDTLLECLISDGYLLQ